MKDGRKVDKVTTEFIADGFYKLGTNSNNIPVYLFLGINAELRKTTEYHLSESISEIFTAAESISLSEAGGSKLLINVSGPSEKVYLYDGSIYYSYSLDYIEFPSAAQVPKSLRVNKRTQISSSGYTLTGSPVITGGSKGLIITETYTDSEGNMPTQGTISNNGLITSVSKSNKRIINGSIYYDYTVTTQEL